MDVNDIIHEFARRKGIAHRGQPAAVGGGSINRAFRLTTDVGDVFVKVNHAARLAMFEAEAEGLAALARTHAVSVPGVLDYGLAGDSSFLALDWVRFGPKTSAAQRRLARGLARQHRIVSRQFGWHRDNTIGSTDQRNEQTDDWVEFFRNQRLAFQLELAANNGLPPEIVSMGVELLGNLESFFGGYRPAASLLHGDLWSGNWGATPAGEPFLFDPAVYFGDREVDLAMTRLFGGFGRAFHETYHADWPLPAGWESRVDLYNLYHLLNHFNLFGADYLSRVESVVRRLLQ